MIKSLEPAARTYEEAQATKAAAEEQERQEAVKKTAAKEAAATAEKEADEEQQQSHARCAALAAAQASQAAPLDGFSRQDRRRQELILRLAWLYLIMNDHYKDDFYKIGRSVYNRLANDLGAHVEWTKQKGTRSAVLEDTKAAKDALLGMQGRIAALMVGKSQNMDAPQETPKAVSKFVEENWNELRGDAKREDLQSKLEIDRNVQMLAQAAYQSIVMSGWACEEIERLLNAHHECIKVVTPDKIRWPEGPEDGTGPFYGTGKEKRACIPIQNHSPSLHTLLLDTLSECERVDKEIEKDRKEGKGTKNAESERALKKRNGIKEMMRDCDRADIESGQYHIVLVAHSRDKAVANFVAPVFAKVAVRGRTSSASTAEGLVGLYDRLFCKDRVNIEGALGYAKRYYI